MEQNTVFISYRRDMSRHLARAIYQDLTSKGWDVFLDVNTMDSGDFDRIILNQIGARAHFLLLISQDSLRRCVAPGDWVLREIQEAVRLERNIVPVIEEGVNFSQEMGYLPAELREITSRKNALPLSHFYFDAGMEMLRTRFLKTPEYIRITEAPAAEQAEVQRRMAAISAESPAPAAKASASPIPAPFAWVDIKGYSIAKYPITNAQFAEFIKAGGYEERKWWTDAGWAQRNQEQWAAPRYWQDLTWNGADHPVVGVSWYEAMAFCQWLSEKTGEAITLPTDEQWQYAAAGDEARIYPWGNTWDCTHCNNSVRPCDSDATTPVSQFEGRGDSPFGVVDMAGNVWEWCLSKAPNSNKEDADRVLRGASWDDLDEEAFRCAYHDWAQPSSSQTMWGFRIVRS